MQSLDARSINASTVNAFIPSNQMIIAESYMQMHRQAYELSFYEEEAGACHLRVPNVMELCQSWTVDIDKIAKNCTYIVTTNFGTPNQQITKCTGWITILDLL